MFNRLYTMTHECKPSRREPISPVSNINHSRAFGPAHGQGHSPAAVRWHTPRPVPSVICISRVLVWFSRGRRFLLVGASVSFSCPARHVTPRLSSYPLRGGIAHAYATFGLRFARMFRHIIKPPHLVANLRISSSSA